jgi:flagella basal body P-ring formation protein FlgA
LVLFLQSLVLGRLDVGIPTPLLDDAFMNKPAISESVSLRRLARASVCHGLAGCAALGAVAVICTAQPAHAQTLTPVRSAPTAQAAQPVASVAFAPGQPAAPGAPVSALPPSHEQLFALARAWVSQEQQLPAEQVQFASLDSRVRIAECGQPLQFDYPFSTSRETVRVRCNQPTPWQLFLRLTGPATARPIAPAPVQTAPARPSGPVMAQTATKTVVVTRRLLQRGTELNASMLEEVQRPALGLDPLAISSLKDAEAAEVVRDIPAGVALRSYDIKRSLMVRKGQLAMLTVGQGGGFQITVKVQAEQDGHLGEQIRLKNTESGRLISGVVTGPNALKGL